MDMPREIRDEVFTLLLCAFESHTAFDERNNTEAHEKPNSILIRHSINTAILRTNSQIHREAYDIMVKTNRFVRVNYGNKIRFSRGLNGRHIPVVAYGPSVELFKGSV
jgi:hypothetical protein